MTAGTADLHILEKFEENNMNPEDNENKNLSEQNNTAPETQTPETNASEKKTPETNASETKTPETEAAEAKSSETKAAGESAPKSSGAADGQKNPYNGGNPYSGYSQYNQNNQGGQSGPNNRYGRYGQQNRPPYGSNQYYSTPRSNYGGRNNYGGPQNNYYANQNYGGPQNYGQPYYAPNSGEAAVKDKSRIPGWGKALIIILVIVLCISLVFYGIVSAIGGFTKALSEGVSGDQTTYETFSFDHDYVGVLYLNGTISDGSSGDGYNQAWMLDCIDQMMNDKLNKGILLFVNTPGGSAFATYDVYHELLTYKETTGRPIYVYMDSQATSGGYYISMAGEKIYAHPECWTGSIGVIVGTLYDFSGLFEKYGIKAYSITSGENKDLGANYKPMTDEQKAILQSLVDESFDRFVQAVCDGRHMDEATVRTLADGRIYSAQQAADNGLIDEVGTLSDAWNDMASTYGFSNVTPESIYYEEPETLRDLLGFSSDITGSEETSELKQLIDLLYEQNSVKIEFIAPVQK
jgi:protease-4